MNFISADILEALGLDWRSMLFYLGNLIILVGVLVGLVYNPVKRILKAKREKLDEVYEENEKLKAESEKLQSDYDKKVEEMNLESARVAADVAKNAQDRADAIVAEAQEKASAIIDAAKKDALYQKEQLKNEFKDSVNTHALSLAQKLLEREITDKDNSELIEQVLSDWED